MTNDAFVEEGGARPLTLSEMFDLPVDQYLSERWEFIHQKAEKDDTMRGVLNALNATGGHRAMEAGWLREYWERRCHTLQSRMQKVTSVPPEPVRDVWFVCGDTEHGEESLIPPMLFSTKMAAEKHARYLFPNEPITTREARVYFREVLTSINYGREGS